MKKITLVFILSIISYSLSFGGNKENDSFWKIKNYSPELFLLIYHKVNSMDRMQNEYKNSNALTAFSCSAFNAPFVEGFNLGSTTFDCWTLLDNNNDRIPTGNNAWKQFNSTPYEGDRSMYFYGTSAIQDDYLISPKVVMAGGIYQISYYYKTNTTNTNDNEFEVLLSTSGIAPVDFTTVLEPAKRRNVGTWTKKSLYVNNVIGDVNIAWHVKGKGPSFVFIDKVTIKKVDCIGPDEEVTINDIGTGSAVFEITDLNNSEWEYFVQNSGTGTVPVGSGYLSKTKSIFVDKVNGAGSVKLSSNTEYEFFFRSSCGGGKNSDWMGPILFRTLCDPYGLPFFEGFNNGSTTLSCWTIMDANKDSTFPTGPNIWKTMTIKYEGTHSMFFNGMNSIISELPHNDWLISPPLKVELAKYYRLRYHYRTAGATKNDFDVKFSTDGINIKDFNKTLISVKEHSGDAWVEEKTFVTAVDGVMNLAWQVISASSATSLYIDNVFFEEVVGCPEPMKLNTKDEKEQSAVLTWNDDFGANWEYIVQTSKGPTPAGGGTATNSKEVTVGVDHLGNTLQPNIEYEYYVRTICGNGEYSVWVGPFAFRTTCSIFKTPFWEGFNNDTNTVNCWTTVDANNDSNNSSGIPTGYNTWKTSFANFEGSHSMYYQGNVIGVKLPHDDWMISPTIQFEAGKVYRLKYHYRTNTAFGSEYEFEILGSNKGVNPIDFTKIIAKKKKYDASAYWAEEYTFISGLSGDVNIAWHVTSNTQSTALYLDNIFIEEVFGCVEPMNLNVDNVDIDKVDIMWEDDFGSSNWEYFVQERGKGMPTSNGTATTTNKVNAISKEQSGQKMKPNTDYEYYVRTTCGGGQYSIWQGPYTFTTSCSVFEAPFLEGFNSDSKSTRCWTLVNKKGELVDLGVTWKNIKAANTMYEGDQGMFLNTSADFTNVFSDWLISPTINLDGGMYVLKYYFKTNTTPTYNNEFEVLLSTEGIDVSKFTTVVVPSTIHRIGSFVEQVVFLDGIKGEVNIAWHVNGSNTRYSNLYLDNINLQKVEGCPEPYYIKVDNITSSTLDVEWTQDGSVTEWEVIVVDYKQAATAVPVKTVIVKNNPKTTITGLDSGKAYTVYVRAKCTDGKTNSNWGTGIDFATLIGANNNCDGAYEIPVNNGLDCEKKLTVSFVTPGLSLVKEPLCNPSITKTRFDVWFEFTATNDIHILNLKERTSMNGSVLSTIYGAIYSQSCSSITDISIQCFTYTTESTEVFLKDLIPGNKYYVRLAENIGLVKEVLSLCLTTASYLEVSASGDTYSVDDLVKKVLVKSECDLVSNINYQNGDGGTKAMSYNTLGYFNRGKTDFPFKEGIVLSTNEVQYVPGPAQASPFGARGGNAERWIGDVDINEVINDAGGSPNGVGDKRVTQLEFDFIPVKDSIKFEYLMASNSYHKDCTNVGCAAGALFAAWLVDSTTGEGQNLAKIRGTDIPISLNTITDSNRTGRSCGSSYPDLYWKHYSVVGDNILGAYVDFVGLTVPMESETVHVVPGRKYHIKLAMIDFCATVAHSSAVFFNAGSFDLGSLDLGEDLLVESNNAICYGETAIIDSGIKLSDELKTEIDWFKDNVLIKGANQPTLEVSESGVYEVKAKFPELNCESSGTVKVEIFPAISKVVNRPEDIIVCANSLNEIDVNLTDVELGMFGSLGKDGFTTSYFETKEDADLKESPIEEANTLVYSLGTYPKAKNIYVRVDNTITGCHEVFVLRIVVESGEFPIGRDDVFICAVYTFPTLEPSQYYYLESAGKGVVYKAGEVLDVPGIHTVYVLQKNSEEGCFEEINYEVSITEAVKADVFEDKVLDCTKYKLEPLSKYNRYFSESGGNGYALEAGTVIPYAQTIFVYAESEDGLCSDESSFTIEYEQCPIQKGISPNGDGLNDFFDLSNNGVYNLKIFNRYGSEVYAFGKGYTTEWMGQDKNGNALPDGTYYYVVISHGITRTGWVQINR